MPRKHDATIGRRCADMLTLARLSWEPLRRLSHQNFRWMSQPHGNCCDERAFRIATWALDGMHASSPTEPALWVIKQPTTRLRGEM
jgi:hypothetical protein